MTNKFSMIKTQNYIEKLQNLDQEAKKIWLIVLTTVSAVILIAFWLFYLNATVLAVNEVEKPGFLQVFKTGLNVVGEKVEFGLANSYIYFSQGRKVDINK